ncbi:MAG: DUF1302 domain-containing protein [Pseudomonadota bacterium]
MACATACSGAQAGSFDFADGDGKISFDSTFSAGILVRAQERDKRVIGIVNGGTSRSVNEDNGNLNYEKGEIVSSLLKANHDFDISYGKTGFFARFGYFKDISVSNKDFGTALPSPEDSPQTTKDLGIITHKRLDVDFELFDAYIRHEFEIAGRPLNVRLGKQVVSWGESTLILGGINVINPVDLTRLRAPGAELKEAFIPVPMLYVSQQLSDNITVEAFNQFKFEPFKIDPLGTFFSSTDVFSPGGYQSFTGFGRTPDNAHGEQATANSTIPRSEDRYASDKGQFGGALRFFLPALNNSEMALYALNYHSRLPLASTLQAPCPANRTLPTGCVPSQREASKAQVFAEYPEDIQLYGLSFNTPGPFGIALQGEYSYRPNLPVQLATVELVLATLGLPNQAGFGSDVPGDPSGPAQAAGTKLQGYKSVEAQQFQFTATKSIPNLLGAEQAIFLGEAAFFYQDLPDNLKFAGPATYLPSRQSNTALQYPSPLVANGSVQPGDEGYATKASYGYRLISRFEYSDVFAGVNLLPRIVFSHDVKGVSTFLTEDVKAVSLGLNATYNQAWNFDMAYTNFFGGRVFKGTDCQTSLTGSTGLGLDIPGAVNPTSGSNLCSAPSGPTSDFGQERTYESIANPNIDRDFVAASLSYSF